MILALPWLVVIVIAYNVIAYLSSWPAITTDGPNPIPTVFDSELFSLTMISGAEWTMTLGNLLIVTALLLLFVELLKSTHTGAISLVDHALSTVLFVICIVEFLVWERAATDTFFIITVITLIDVIAGFSITIQGARRDFGFGSGGAH